MIERIRKWLAGPDDQTLEQTTMREVEHDRELTETRQLVRESEQKSQEAGARLDDYQARVRRETQKRLAVATGGKVKDG